MVKILLFIFLIVLTESCATQRSLQKAVINGLPHEYPIHVIENQKDHKHSINFQLNISNETDLKFNTGTHSKVNKNGDYIVTPVEGTDLFIPDTTQNKYEFKGTNLLWEIPRSQLLVDYNLSLNHLTYILSGQVGLINDKLLWGAKIGIGLFYEYKYWAWHFENYLNIHRIKYDVNYIEGEKRISFHEKTGQNTIFNVSSFITLNTKVSSWPFNLFVRSGWGRLTLFNFFQEDFEQDDNYRLVSLGIFKTLLTKRRILLGINIYRHLTGSPQNYYYDLFLQYQIFFN